MTEDEGSAILATSILASFPPLSSLKRVAKFFSSSSLKKYYAGNSGTGVTSDPCDKDDDNHKTGKHVPHGGHHCCPGSFWIPSLQNSQSSDVFASSEKEDEIRPDLVKFDDVPAYLQFNQYVLRGYRPPNLTGKQCLMSLLYFHNETINIMTHGECHSDLIVSGSFMFQCVSDANMLEAISPMQ
jgi:hypothetical protein